jgi:large subunit ribosomal protein L25
MLSLFEFAAESRVDVGTGKSRRFRRAGRVPAVLYGGGKSPLLLSLNHNEVIKRLEHESVYSHVLDIVVDGVAEKAILKAVQRNPSKFQVLHMDFLRVSAGELLRAKVPLHFINESISVGVKKGGVANHVLTEVEVQCLPGVLPDFIEVDLVSLDVNETCHLSDLKLPDGVKIIALSQGEDHDLSVVSILPSKSGDAG